MLIKGSWTDVKVLPVSLEIQRVRPESLVITKHIGILVTMHVVNTLLFTETSCPSWLRHLLSYHRKLFTKLLWLPVVTGSLPLFTVLTFTVIYIIREECTVLLAIWQIASFMINIKLLSITGCLCRLFGNSQVGGIGSEACSLVYDLNLMQVFAVLVLSKAQRSLSSWASYAL